MSQTFLKQLQNRKDELIHLAEKAAEYGWIPTQSNQGNDVISLQEIKDKIANDTLVLGVIGQMKCGKSTFLNSFVFEEDILPAATTPMTAALSVITYGEKKRIVAEFYTRDEWEVQKYLSERSLDDVKNSQIETNKVKAAKDLVSRASKLGTSIDTYLGKTQEDDFSRLIDYVGADGKYVSITKAVTIYYPKEYLKGVEIVDTPGFNDPIISREERTREFLKKADVVLMMLYAGRVFDATDHDILFKTVRQSGIGKVLIGINKYDVAYNDMTNPMDETELRDYVVEEIKKACRECNDDTLNNILKETEPIPFSAEMALLSELPMSKISSKESFSHAWKCHCENFGISSQAEMKQYSHINELTEAIKSLVYSEKESILFAKPLNAIFAAGDKKKTNIEKQLSITKETISTLLLPDTELDDKEESISKANKRLSKKISNLGDDIYSEFRQIIRKGKRELEDIVDASFDKMRSILKDNWPIYKGFDYVRPYIETELDNLITRKLKRATEQIADEGKRKIDSCTNLFFSDAEDVLLRFLPDFDSRDFVKSIQQQIRMDIEDSDLFKTDGAEDDDNYGLLDILTSFINGASFGAAEAVGNIIVHDQEVSERISCLNQIRNGFNPEPYLEHAFHSKDVIIGTIKQKFLVELLEPLQQQIKGIREIKDTKATELECLKADKTTLEGELSSIKEQLVALGQMKEKLTTK